MIKKKFILILFSFSFLLFINVKAENQINESAKKIADSLKIEVATKGKKLKEFFSGNIINLKFNNKELQYKFKEKSYEVFESDILIEKGKWKLSGLLKNQIKLKAKEKKRSYYLKKISKKNKIYHYNSSPGNKDAKKTVLEIISSSNNMDTIKTTQNDESTSEKKIVKKEKTKVKKKKKINNPLNKLSKDLNKGLKEIMGLPSNDTTAKSQKNNQQQYLLEKYRASSDLSYFFFEASINYLQSLELLYRAYDNNVEADKLVSSIDYIKNSKASEVDRLNSTKSIIDTGSVAIKSSIQDTSYILSEQGRSYYEQALPFAIGALQSTLNLYNSSKGLMENLSGSGQLSGIDLLLNNANDIAAAATIIPKIPEFSKNMVGTIRLVLSGAKEKKIRSAGNYNEALNELNLDEFD